jgi:hypothetical protein
MAISSCPVARWPVAALACHVCDRALRDRRFGANAAFAADRLSEDGALVSVWPACTLDSG